MFILPYWSMLGCGHTTALLQSDLDPRYHVEDEIILTVAITDISNSYTEIVLNSTNRIPFDYDQDDVVLTSNINTLSNPYSVRVLTQANLILFTLTEDEIVITNRVIV